jgi:hypothetical protein
MYNKIYELKNKMTTLSVPQYYDLKVHTQETTLGGNDLYTPHFTLPTN